MNSPTLTCQSEQRRHLVAAAGNLFALDYVEVRRDETNDPPTLIVYFLGRAPAKIGAASVRIVGGERIRDIQVKDVQVHQADDQSMDAFMEVTVDKDGDFSTYRLSVADVVDTAAPADNVRAGFDPRYASVAFSFKACCPSDLDCKQPAVCPPPGRVEPEINYLAKDYASFRQLILDRLALLTPDWQERHVPDIGITLVELLAYVGDYLSYYQDAVATEAYLDTARKRISVRRHARLVDYQMHEGCNARVWITVATSQKVPPPDVKLTEVYFSTESADDDTEIFEPIVCKPDDPLRLFAAHSTIYFYTWGDQQCCLPRGATTATLKDDWDGPASEQGPRPRRLHLTEGEVVLFEEVKGPKTGNPADADRTRRWAVRLTKVERALDPLNQQPVLEIEWGVKDALPFALCISVRRPAPDCDLVSDISIARGNVILADHGETIDPPEDLGSVGKKAEIGCCECEGSTVEMTAVPQPFQPVLKRSPLTFTAAAAVGVPASQTLQQDPRRALPAIKLDGISADPEGAAPLFSSADLRDPTLLANRLLQRADVAAQFLYGQLTRETQNQLDQWSGKLELFPGLLEVLRAELSRLLTVWTPQRDLLESSPEDLCFVVEMDNEGQAHLRFGKDGLGKQPESGMGFLARYRLGNGKAGNVAADTITRIQFRKTSIDGANFIVRNPLPAQGGTDPEPLAEVKLFAPGAFRTVLERAITAADYATLAERNHEIQQANASLRWTGSWYEAQVAVDPVGSETADETLLRGIRGHLHRYRRVGHDLVVNQAPYVPLDIEMTICVLPQFQRGHVEAALLQVFGSRAMPNGRLGFFHPDNLTFGEGIYLSKIVAAAQAVAGVESVKVTKFQRLFEPANHELETGVLTLGSTEIAQLDNNPSFPEHGAIKFNLRGGR